LDLALLEGLEKRFSRGNFKGSQLGNEGGQQGRGKIDPYIDQGLKVWPGQDYTFGMRGNKSHYSFLFCRINIGV
jgi:hypothetical protein